MGEVSTVLASTPHLRWEQQNAPPTRKPCCILSRILYATTKKVTMNKDEQEEFIKPVNKQIQKHVITPTHKHEILHLKNTRD